MDSLTQIVLGGAVGEAVLGKKVGNKAILWGAIAGTIPDLDTIPGQFMDTVSRLEIHRGFSHSIVFAILISPLLGWLVTKIYKGKKAGFADWTKLFFWAIFTHPLLDIFTTWGTQLFWPLDWRIAIQSIFVIDPLYTLPFLCCLLIVFFLHRTSQWRRKINATGLLISTVYLLWSVVSKYYAEGQIKAQLAQRQVKYLEIDSRPTPLNTILWTANVEKEQEFRIKFYSLLDEQIDTTFLQFPKNEHLLKPYRNHPKIERLIFLTKGKYVLEETDEGVAMHDLRFGLLNPFSEGPKRFVFTYLITEKNGKIIIEQNRNTFEDAGQVLDQLWRRIQGVMSV
jgi:inner membrane protein